jgi:hypothetical protein
VFALEKEEKSYRLVSEFSPASEGMPMKALISNGGSYVVTLDGGHGMGRGDDVVVAYKGDGTKLRSWRLDEILTKEDIATVPSSVSADWWRQEVVIANSRPQLNRPPELVIIGPGGTFATTVKRYWYRLDFVTLTWTKTK